MTHNDNLTVLICTWNRAALLDETLASLAAMDVPRDRQWDVTVVDNNSSDHTRDVVAARVASFPVPLRYLFEPRQGKSWAMNAGLQHTHSAVVAFADDDVRVSPHWLATIAATFRDYPDVAYVGGRVDPIWEAPCPEWFERTDKALWGTLAILDYGPEPFVFEERRKIPLGANFAIRRTIIDRVGAFNPTLGRNSDRVILGQELPEFFARVRAAGLRGRYLPNMSVQHHVPAKRLRPSYLRRWWYGKGISRARMEAIHPVTELGVDLRRVPRIAGIPRFLFGSAIRDGITWLAAVAHRDAARRLVAETRLCYFGGQLRERLRHG
jgi:glycosyltransferase involved in cell wall biosynthesis